MMQHIEYRAPFIHVLQREVNHRVRYYSLKIYKTLFGEYVLEKKYGSIKNKAPTGIKLEYYDKLEDALIAIKKRVQEKLKRGYTDMLLKGRETSFSA